LEIPAHPDPLPAGGERERTAIGQAANSDAFKTALTNAGQDLAYLDGPDFQKFWDEDGKRTDEAVIAIGRQG